MVKFVSAPCLKALKGTLEDLSLADNNLTEHHFNGALRFGRDFEMLRSLDLSHNLIETIPIDRNSGESGFSLALSDFLLRQGFSETLSMLGKGDIPPERKILGSFGGNASRAEVIQLHGNPVTKVFFRWLPFHVAQAWVTLLGSTESLPLKWFFFDTVDFTAIAPGTFRAMPSMRKITFLAHKSTLRSFIQPMHSWGLPLNAKVCHLDPR